MRRNTGEDAISNQKKNHATHAAAEPAAVAGGSAAADGGSGIWRLSKEYEDGHRWTARDRTKIAKMERYLSESDIVKAEFDELELPLGPEDSEVDVRYILIHATRIKSRRIFQTFGSQGLSEFLFASTLRRERR